MQGKRSTIGLLTDFGSGDWYVGVMKGVILSVNPQAAIVDISHAVPRHDVGAASFALLASYKYLPDNAIIVTVVDPGVGTERRIICAKSAGRFFLAPDNGVLTGVLEREGYEEIVSVENESLFLKPVSSTFHGRDVFAPVAGHLSLGLGIAELGPGTADFATITVPRPQVGADHATVTIQWIDSFGNLITDCSGDLVEELVRRWGAAGIDLGSGGSAATGGADSL